jgi:hypothetical protein
MGHAPMQVCPVDPGVLPLQKMAGAHSSVLNGDPDVVKAELDVLARKYPHFQFKAESRGGTITSVVTSGSDAGGSQGADGLQLCPAVEQGYARYASAWGVEQLQQAALSTLPCDWHVVVASGGSGSSAQRGSAIGTAGDGLNEIDIGVDPGYEYASSREQPVAWPIWQGVLASNEHASGLHRNTDDGVMVDQVNEQEAAEHPGALSVDLQAALAAWAAPVGSQGEPSILQAASDRVHCTAGESPLSSS